MSDGRHSTSTPGSSSTTTNGTGGGRSSKSSSPAGSRSVPGGSRSQQQPQQQQQKKPHQRKSAPIPRIRLPSLSPGSGSGGSTGGGGGGASSSKSSKKKGGSRSKSLGGSGGPGPSSSSWVNKTLSRDDVILPQTRVKIIMKSSPQIENIGNDSLFLLTKATELFIDSLVTKCCELSKGKEIEYKHLANVVHRAQNLNFLLEVTPRKVLARTALQEIGEQSESLHKELIE